ncbi:hypothetical protein KJ785_01150 [Patescibacteria group bacterium]|nr:hypothetical protein [Patescibacteria group bacterium]
MRKTEEIKEIFIEYILLAKVEESIKIHLRMMLEYLSDLELRFIDRYLIGSVKNVPITDIEDALVCASMADMFILVEEIKSGLVQPFTPGDLQTEIKSVSDLKDYDKQKRFLASVFELEKGVDYDLAVQIITILEELSNYTFLFPLLSDLENIMYRRIYIFALVNHFSAVSDNSRRAFLSSNLFVQGLNMDLDVYGAVEKFIRSFFMVNIRRNISLDYAACLAINNGKIGIDDYEKRITAKDWISKVSEFLQTPHDSTEINIFYSSDQSYRNNLVFEKARIKQVVDLYIALVSGEFIFEKGTRQEIEKIIKELEEIVPVGLEDKELSFEEKIIKEKTNLMVWLTTSDGLLSLVSWLDEEKNKKEGAKKLVISILKKYGPNLLNENEQIERLMRLQEVLRLMGYGDTEEWFLFDEKIGAFMWSD